MSRGVVQSDSLGRRADDFSFDIALRARGRQRHVPGVEIGGQRASPERYGGVRIREGYLLSVAL